MEQGFVKQRMSVENMEEKQTKIIGVRPTKDDSKVQLVFLQNTGQVNLLAMHNLGDERWNSSNGRPAWITSTLTAIEALYGSTYPEVLVASKKCIEDQDYVSLDINNPEIQGNRVVVQFNETLTPRATDIATSERLKQNAKQDGNGNFLLKDGYAIFERITLDFMKNVDEIHNRIEHDSSTTDFQDLQYQEPNASSTATKEPAPKGDKDLVGKEQ